MNEDERLLDILETIDSLCWESDWTQIDNLLKEAENEKIIAIRLCWLIATHCVKDKLKNREKYFQNTEEMLKNNPKKQALLIGL